MTGKWPAALDSGWIEPLDCCWRETHPSQPLFFKKQSFVTSVYKQVWAMCVLETRERWDVAWAVAGHVSGETSAGASAGGKLQQRRFCSNTGQDSAALWSQNVCTDLSAQQQGFGSQQRILHAVNVLRSLLTKGTREASCSLCQGVWVRSCRHLGLLSNVRWNCGYWDSLGMQKGKEVPYDEHKCGWFVVLMGWKRSINNLST